MHRQKLFDEQAKYLPHITYETIQILGVLYLSDERRGSAQGSAEILKDERLTAHTHKPSLTQSRSYLLRRRHKRPPLKVSSPYGFRTPDASPLLRYLAS